MSYDLDVQRVAKIAREGLEHTFSGEIGDELRMDTFAVVAVFTWTDAGGDEHEYVSIWSESRREYVRLGLLQAGLDMLREEPA